MTIFHHFSSYNKTIYFFFLGENLHDVQGHVRDIFRWNKKSFLLIFFRWLDVLRGGIFLFFIRKRNSRGRFVEGRCGGFFWHFVCFFGMLGVDIGIAIILYV